MKLVAALCAGVLVLSTGASVASVASDRSRADVPSRAQWVDDVDQAMKRSGKHLRKRVAAGTPEERPAINFDIDNSSIASYYDGEGAGAIPRVKRYADLATSLGVDLVFNTGRIRSSYDRTLEQLTAAGYPVAALCLRRKGETIPRGKQRCRDRFIRRGYTLVANVGNNPTDFTGTGYERAYRLPNYGGELG
jgi:hypothetical protein